MKRLLLFFCVLPPLVFAQPEIAAQKTLTVGVNELPPFVMKGPNGTFGGFAIDLWEAIAREQGWKTKYVEASTLPELVDWTRTGKVDLAVTDMFITSERFKDVDFTQPYYDSGLRVTINKNTAPTAAEIWKGLRESGHLRVYMWGGIILLILTVLVTFFERKFDPEFHKEWSMGLAQSFYHVMSIAMTGKTNHKQMFGAMGRVIAALWIACGVAIVAYITSSMTSVMTTSTLSNQVHGPDDLGNKTVGVILGSLGEKYARKNMLNIHVFQNAEEADRGWESANIHAFIGDTAVMAYYMNQHRNARLKQVGPIFEQDKVGFALPIGSPLVRPINMQILLLKESGYIDTLKTKYFGKVF